MSLDQNMGIPWWKLCGAGWLGCDVGVEVRI